MTTAYEGREGVRHFYSLTTPSAACISLNDGFSLTSWLTQYYQNGKENITMKEIKRRDRKKSVTVAMINVNNIRKTYTGHHM